MTAGPFILAKIPVARLRRRAFLLVAGLVFAVFLALTGAAQAQLAPFGADQLKVVASAQDNYGRVVLNFPRRTDMPDHTLNWDNGVLVIAFEQPVSAELPDLSEELPDFISAARLDPDGRGLRIGLKREFTVNKTEAGERLFIDILPLQWEGIEPGLPREVVEELSARAKAGLQEEERQRKAEFVLKESPKVSVRVGRHPTFLRLLFDWSIDATGVMEREEGLWRVKFDWPVPIGIYDLKADLPAEIEDVINRVDSSGSSLDFRMADGVEPRFYPIDSMHFALDIDIAGEGSETVDLARLLPEAEERPKEPEVNKVYKRDEPARVAKAEVKPAERLAKITPFVENVGNSVRIVFPFQEDTAAAVFRRGDTLWMIFDTDVSIGAPEDNDGLNAMVSEMNVQPVGNTSVVRLSLTQNNLATLGSEGRSWVLALGDSLLTPAELITLSRRQTAEGLFEMVADVDRPSRVHELRDPEVGDVLSVVTAFPPSRGIVRDFDFVDFTALRSVHGLVIQPTHEAILVDIESRNAVVRSDYGLIVSAPQLTRNLDDVGGDIERVSYIDLTSFEEPSPDRFVRRREELLQEITEATATTIADARFNLAKLFLANQFHYEAVGVLKLMDASTNGSTEMQVAEAAAQTMAGRWQDAMEILGREGLAASPDALIWRTITRAGAGDYSGARRDALVAELSLEGYPSWVREKFLLSASKAAIEEQDIAFANRMLGLVHTSALEHQALTEYEILAARLDEAAGRYDEALDTLGQVITADIRPTRAEAIYRTMRILDKMDRLDLVRAADSLSSEVLVWRGDVLEASMLKLLAELSFRNGDYRQAFETVRALANARPDAQPTAELLETAREVFANLYLNGEADVLPAVDALTLYYDFRNFTPAGARGDEMVRNLVRRLISFDLLEQAGELLQYQVDARLEGAAKAQIAADLAVVYLAQRRPEKALNVLNKTRVVGVAPGLERQRRVLEARSLIDADREDLAIDLLSSMDGRDADLLRVDAQWSARRYQEASEILELLYSDVIAQGELADSGRLDIVKAAVGFVLSGDKIGVGRLRERFSQSMAGTPQWPLFDFVTGDVQLSGREFKKIAKDVVGADTLNAFLTTYRDVYGVDGALAPDGGAGNTGV